MYFSWCGRCFEDADKIYVLDMPKYLYKFRIIKRMVKRKLGLEKGKKETLKSVYNLLKWTDKFQKQNLPEIKKMLAEYVAQVIINS